MPRPRMPPTPLSSADISAQEKSQAAEMESVFALPPPAMQSANGKHGVSKSYTRTTNGEQSSPPISPKDGKARSALQRKRTISGGTKPRSEPTSATSATLVQQQMESTLPPPPSRARKIIQMKPKQAANTASEQPNSTLSTKEASASSPSGSRRKQTQPSATSAAGRKIARKTAHSIIERRRRSKMNEEFGVLKDMIPACSGVEMHKLAILQAGIEYVKYLEGCVEKLKAQTGQNHSEHDAFQASRMADEDEDDEEEDDSMDISPEHQDTSAQFPSFQSARSDSETTSPSALSRPPLPKVHQQRLPPFRKSSISTSATNSAHQSPDMRPLQSLPSIPGVSSTQTHSFQVSNAHSVQQSAIYSTSPPSLTTQAQIQIPTGVSPAFGALYFSPDISRTSNWSSINAHATMGKASPNILPLPQAALPFSTASTTIVNGAPIQGTRDANHGDDQAEVTATAALLMMTKDRRGSVGLPKSTSSKGMSVRDLLSS